MNGRVALVASSSADVGPRAMTERLAFLLRAGWDARLLCRGEPWRDHPALRDPAVADRIVRARHLREPPSPFSRKLRRLAPDLIHFESAWAASAALNRGDLGDARIIVSLRDDGRDLALPDPSLVWTRAQALVFGHRAGLKRAVARGWPETIAEVIPAAVPDPGPVPISAVDSGSDAQSESGVLNVLSAGPVIWEQGLEHSVHAVALALERGIACRYRIVGEGDHLHAVAFARHQLGLSDRVELLESEGGERLAAELGRADVFIDPAVTDTTTAAPLSAARARGVAFIATPRPGLRERGGLIVPRRDPHALAQALVRLAEDPKLRARLGGEGRADTPANGHLEQLEQLYRRTLSTGQG